MKRFFPSLPGSMMIGVLLISAFVFPTAALAREAVKDPQIKKRISVGSTYFDWMVSGQIKDDQGTPLAGATISLLGASTNALSDESGNFQISVTSPDDSIRIEYIGYLSQTIKVGNRKNISVVLTPNLETKMNEVVVIGYGRQKRVNLTGSVSTMNAKQLSIVPAGNVSNLLAGNLPGLIAVQRSGEPGNDEPQLSIRGFGNALVVVDGIVGRSFSRLDPNEIESITILKDAASTSVYGVSGGNGVILVTTKKGKVGKPEINYSINYGVQHVTRYPKFVNSAEFAILKNDASYNIGGGTIFTDEEIEKFRAGNIDPVNYPNFDYYNYFVKDYTPQVQQNISLRGGTENFRYFFLLGKFSQESMWNGGNQDFGKYNIRSNVEANIGENFTVSLDLGGRVEMRNNLVQDAYLMSSWMQYQWPIYNPLTPDGKINSGNYGLSAYLNTDLTGYIQNRINAYQGNLSITYKVPFVKGLSARITGAYDLYTEDRKHWTKRYGLHTYNETTQTSVETGSREINSLTLSNAKTTLLRMQGSLNYNNKFGQHTVGGLLLYEEMEDNSNSFAAARINYVVPIDQIFAGPTLNQTNSGTASDNGRKSYVGRVNYDFADKYLLEYSFRYDGSPKFPANKRWGFFSGYSAGWRLSRENWLKDKLGPVDELKLRASYGTTGYDGIAPFQYIAGYVYPSTSYVLGGNSVSNGIVDAGVPNPNVTWEELKTFNIGLDISMWQRLLEFEVDVFNRNRTGILATRALQLPSTFGATLPSENLNSDNVRGFEFVVRHTNSFNKVRYNVSANVTYMKAKWKHVESREFTSSDDRWRNDLNDRWVNRFFGLKAIGQFQSMDEIKNAPVQDGKANSTLLPGDIKFDDFNKDGVIDVYDRQPLGRGTIPEINYGLNLNVTWKNLSVTMLWQGGANFVVQMQHFLIQPFANNMNTYAYFMDRWRRADPKNPNSEWIPGKYPATRNDGTPNNNQFSSFWLKDASYVRLKALNIGYTLEIPALRKIGLKDISVFVSGQNLLTFTKLEYMDPETPSGRLSVYPLQKTYNAGISVTF